MRRPQVWRKMQTGFYPGQYSVSNADFLHFSVNIDLVLDFKEGDPKPTVQVAYRIDGDEVNRYFFDNMEEALAWVETKAEKAVNDNINAIATGEDCTIEDA